jgi:glutaryl-CoA dehydrogenase (non-decarboxylating)
VTLDGCRVPADHLVGRVGFGFSHVANTALDHGRYSVAWGAVGIAQACLDACSEYTASRRQFGKPIAEHQLVQRKLTRMIVDTRAARLLCFLAGYRRSIGDPDAASETLIAKYFASRAATRAASDAVQLHGANGLSQDYPVERYLRDAKVTEIIEGSTQIQEIAIARCPPTEL